MAASKQSLGDSLVKVIATGLGTGLVPFIPGTAASAAIALIYLLVAPETQVRLVITAVLLFLGFATSGRAERLLGTKDDKRIVIDEFAGMAIGLMAVDNDQALLLMGFLVFRVLDTLKVFPSGRLQGLRGAAGVMADDIIAGIYTYLILSILSFLISFG